jgi:hypothetical protein
LSIIRIEKLFVHIDIIAPNFTNFYHQIFKIFKFMFFMEGTQKKMKLSRKVITHPSPLFCSFHCFACDYLQTGYSDMLDISYLFNNTLKCIKAKTLLHQILQTFTIRFLKYVNLCFSWMAPRKKWNCREKLSHTHPLLVSYARYFIFIQQHSSVLKPKYSLSIRNKCAYLLESSETCITI